MWCIFKWMIQYRNTQFISQYFEKVFLLRVNVLYLNSYNFLHDTVVININAQNTAYLFCSEVLKFRKLPIYSNVSWFSEITFCTLHASKEKNILSSLSDNQKILYENLYICPIAIFISVIKRTNVKTDLVNTYLWNKLMQSKW